ncbi:glycosyltransferase family 9 protein [Sphingomonas sp. PB4P5]|uniref:glycosyltransferase family 9 protein n=1 Tax=Parasphingomonas puruogangriensis TaxID=3096155 RepID=UPI002FCABFCE
MAANAEGATYLGSDAKAYENDLVYVDQTLARQSRTSLTIDHRPAVCVTKAGTRRRTHLGDGATVAGIDAVRGYFVSDVPILKIEIYLDSELLCSCTPLISALRNERSNPDMKKYAFNAWLDFTHEKRGKRELILRATTVDGRAYEGETWLRSAIIVAEPLSEDRWNASDAVISKIPDMPGATLEERINALPTSVHKASSNSVPIVVKRILVMRIDQLGDMAVSVPALRRLREIVPDAHITGLLSSANEGLGRTLGLFDDVIVVDIPDDDMHQRRVLDEQGQIDLARQLEPHRFDVAIDLAVSGVSYKLLHLTGAPVTMGFGGDGWMTLNLGLTTRDPKSGSDLLRHSARTRLLIEAFGAWLDSGAAPLRRPDLDRSVLNSYGITNDDVFVVLHTGARIQFTRWHGYLELAERLLAESGLKIVLMSDKPDEKIAALAARYPDRIVATFGKIAFDHFDAFVSYCSVFVGNDSGPKHFAALRGAQVVSIHSSRIDWNEWGQEMGGVILSRKVPCAGCYLHHASDECAKDVACIKLIRVDEVLHEVKTLLHDGATTPENHGVSLVSTPTTL